MRPSTSKSPSSSPFPIGSVVRFTIGSLGLSRRDDLGHCVHETAERGDVGVVAFMHPNQKACRGWFYVEVDSRLEPSVKLYAGVSPNMVEGVSVGAVIYSSSPSPSPRARYEMRPAPRSNPDALLSGAWIVVDADASGRIVARFAIDGRDRAEAWIAKHRSKREVGVAAGIAVGTTVDRALCRYCGHTFADHSTERAGFWACASPARCVCAIFVDRDGFPVPIKKG